ncbi:hypothetical protein CL619_05120 [archaeon]|nr:hypothetical protein [archaeon]
MPEYQNYGERNLVINHRALNYSGIFHVKELFDVINKSLLDKGYTLRDKRNEEVVSETGKNYYLEIRPFKDKTKYVALMQKIVIRLRNVTKTVQEFDGNQINFDNGEIEIVFDAWSYTDYEDRWGMKPVVSFMKMLINQWIMHLPMESGFTNELVSDTAYIHSKVKELLESYRRRDRTYVSEVDVRSEMEKEVLEAERSSKFALE